MCAFYSIQICIVKQSGVYHVIIKCKFHVVQTISMKIQIGNVHYNQICIVQKSSMHWEIIKCAIFGYGYIMTAKE